MTLEFYDRIGIRRAYRFRKITKPDLKLLLHSCYVVPSFLQLGCKYSGTALSYDSTYVPY